MATFGLSVALLLLAAFFAVVAYEVVTTDPRVGFGIDFRIMRELGRRWLASGTTYLPYQLSRPYSSDATWGRRAVFDQDLPAGCVPALRLAGAGACLDHAVGSGAGVTAIGRPLDRRRLLHALVVPLTVLGGAWAVSFAVLAASDQYVYDAHAYWAWNPQTAYLLPEGDPDAMLYAPR